MVLKNGKGTYKAVKALHTKLYQNCNFQDTLERGSCARVSSHAYWSYNKVHLKKKIFFSTVKYGSWKQLVHTKMSEGGCGSLVLC